MNAIASADRFSIFTPRAQGEFLANLQLYGNVRLACRAARVSAQTAYRARRRSTALARAWDAARVAARDHAEQVLAERAIEGVEEAVYYHGEEVARRRRYDSRLLLAHLARLDRLAEREDMGAALARLDEDIEGLRRGEALSETLSETCEPSETRKAACGEHARERAAIGHEGEGAEGVGNKPQDRVPCVPSRRIAEASEWLEDRLDRMEAARPADAPKLATFRDAGAAEYAQLLAFEEGAANWWLLDGQPNDKQRLEGAGGGEAARSGGSVE